MCSYVALYLLDTFSVYCFFSFCKGIQLPVHSLQKCAANPSIHFALPQEKRMHCKSSNESYCTAFLASTRTLIRLILRFSSCGSPIRTSQPHSLRPEPASRWRGGEAASFFPFRPTPHLRRHCNFSLSPGIHQVDSRFSSCGSSIRTSTASLLPTPSLAVYAHRSLVCCNSSFSSEDDQAHFPFPSNAQPSTLRQVCPQSA